MLTRGCVLQAKWPRLSKLINSKTLNPSNLLPHLSIKLHNIKKELQYLENKVLNNDPIVENLTKELFEINSKLWDIENNKRRCESENNFGWGFIQLARDVYFYNDKRAEIKRKINIHTNSDVVEEKQYTDYE